MVVSCRDTGPEPVATLVVTPGSLSLMVSETVQLRASPQNENGVTLPNRAISWASQNPGIASVSAVGRVTAEAIGSTVILANSGGVVAQIAVTVEAAIGEIELRIMSSGLAQDADGYQLLLDGRPSGAPLQTTDSVVIALPPGAHTATLVDLDGPCVIDGELTRTLFVVPRQRHLQYFIVDCRLNGQLLVRTQTSGGVGAIAPYRLTVDGHDPMSIDANGEVRMDVKARFYGVSLNTQNWRCQADSVRRDANVPEAGATTVLFRVNCIPGILPLSGAKLFVASGSGDDSRIEVMDPDGTNRFAIGGGPLGAGYPALSTDGRYLAYARSAVGGSYLVIQDLATGSESVSNTARQMSSFSWSPDGQRLVTSYWNQTWSVVILRQDGTVDRNLPYTTARRSSARWSPDGSTIAITAGDHTIDLMNADGTNLRALVSSATRSFDAAEWSTDGRSLLVRSYEEFCYYSYYCYPVNGRLSVLDLATRQETFSTATSLDAASFSWGSTPNEFYFVQSGDVFKAALPDFRPIRVIQTMQNEWSVLWARLPGPASVRDGGQGER